jgi:hypothetical protein
MKIGDRGKTVSISEYLKDKRSDPVGISPSKLQSAFSTSEVDQLSPRRNSTPAMSKFIEKPARKKKDKSSDVRTKVKIV